MTAVPAGAQVVIMRKMMPFKPSAEPIFENPVSTKPGEEPVVTNPNAYYSWVVAPWEQKGVCGSQGTQTRAVNCKRTDGTIVPDSRCIGNGSGPKPIGAQPVEITQTCGYQWDTGDWIDPGSACTTSEKQTRDVFCRRSDGKVTTDDYCGSGKPLDKQTVPDFSACSYKWAPGSWSEPTNQCGASTQTREVTCERSNGDKVSDDLCNAGGAGAKPALTQEAYVISGCKANWSPAPWGTPVPACGTSTQTRTVTCLRADGVTVSDDQCILEKPATTQPVKDYTTCIDGRTPENPWGWTVGQYGPPSTTCGQAVRTRSVVCTDDDGGAVPDSRCRLAKPQTELKSLETSSCTFKWEVGEYGPFQPACGKTARVRSVVCMRSDGTAMSDGACSAVGAKPAMTEPYTDYSACTFGWAVGTWGAWSSTCGTGTQTRSVVCQRSDGTAATEDNCKLEKPASTQTGYQTTGCTFGWQSGQWQSPEACGDVTQTRTVQCVRSDGQVIEDATCAAMFAKPTGTQAGKNYATCSYAWAVGSYGGWSTTCGRATSARTVTCQRSDGVNVSDASCASVGAKPEATQVSEQTSGCTFSWKADIWQAPAPACGTSVQSRTVTCTRSDGTVADPSRCTAAMPATQQAANDYSTCGYTWEASNWNSNDLCGESAIQTRSVMCRRSDGPTTTDQNCIIYGAGPKPASSQTVSTFTGCGYSWRVAYGAWSSTCSDSATRINTVTCQRSDGVAVDDSMCAGEVPARQNTQGVYSTCTYAATYSTEFGQCKPSTTNGATGYQLAPIQSCRRSDGTIVDNAMCNPQQKSQSCVVASGQNFIRQPYYLQDPNYFSFSQQSMNTDTSNELRFVVQNTICYDTANRSYPSDSYCNGQPYGANTYDIASVPATYVPSMREIWVSQADLMALAPRGWVYGYIDMRDYCSRTPSIYVRSGGTNQTWVVRCGTPDTSNHYVRAPSTLADPVSILPAGVRAKNQSSTASVYNMAVQNTMCYDTISKSSVNATKCQYLPSGTNVYDIVSIPAVFVKELREIWLAPADFKAALPYGGYIGYYDAATTCNSGFTASIGTEGSFQSWTVRCGTPDRADRYVRSPSVLVDPGSVATPSQLTNSSVNASVYKMLVSNTMCYDTFGRTSASYSKCQYLSTGANVYDLVSIPATFVKDLREIYVQRTDLQAALQYGNQLGSGYYSLDYVCQYGMSAYVYPNGAAGSSVGGQGWTLRCGAPDSPANYARVPTGLADAVSAGMPAGSDVWLNPEGASSLKLAVRYVDCINVNTKGSVASSKCQYLTSGTNVYDVLSVPATFVKDLRTIYVDKDKLNALFPRGYGDIGSRDVNYFCQYGTMYVGNASGYASYNVRCTAPDSGDHYTRYATRYDDPFQYYSDGQSPARYVNDSNRSSLTLTVRETGCYDTAANRNGYDACSYVPSGPRGYDQVSVPAVWDVQNKRVTVSKADLKALSALTPETAYMNYVCGRSVYASYGGTGYYTVVCN